MRAIRDAALIEQECRVRQVRERIRQTGIRIACHRTDGSALRRRRVHGDRAGLVKIVGDNKYGELLGGHIIGAKAAELIQELVNVRALDGGYTDAARIIHGHPTLSEVVMEPARAADGWLIHG